jgi:hypothetical protein
MKLPKLQGVQKRTSIASKNYNSKCLFNKGGEAQQTMGRRKNPSANPKQGVESQRVRTNRGANCQEGREAACKHKSRRKS